ncbi:hypothetical protein BDV28DRAFT_163734 [Aspergillus coremiiformis]|uniref:Uncharacterized protein n=1 Tax=Aspergillus coremiiformis TaxID=138285 RepID=A0A5N6YUW0_9EURO|nr:hypothetical protein BDV28DRAFT_163734 [Aspergillus coremiiformis]
MFLTMLFLTILTLLARATSQPLEDLSSSAPSAIGTIGIENHMGATVYFWSVDDKQGPMRTIEAGRSYVEEYRLRPNGGGISIKLAMSPDITNIIQFEYTRLGDKVWWDVSCVDTKPGSPFYAKGIKLDSATPQCPHNFVCAPGDERCPFVYHVWNDDHATHGCPVDSFLHLTLGV